VTAAWAIAFITLGVLALMVIFAGIISAILDAHLRQKRGRQK
jgi:hypothetical protein